MIMGSCSHRRIKVASCVVQHQEHDGIDKMVPVQTTVDSKLPGRGTVGSNDGGDAKHTVEKK